MIESACEREPAMPGNQNTDPKVLERLTAAASRPLSPEERRAQRVSFVMSSLSKGNTMSRESVEALIEKRSI